MECNEKVQMCEEFAKGEVAFKKFTAKELPAMKTEHHNLTDQEYKQKLQEAFKTSPMNLNNE
tara:strand:+ start:379 stop:564 length:186 start_codon:yes stop_codon:yes gene_type:complete